MARHLQITVTTGFVGATHYDEVGESDRLSVL